MESFLPVALDDDFPLANLPWGVFSTKDEPNKRRIGVALGEYAVDCGALSAAGLFTGPILSRRAAACFENASTLNEFMASGPAAWRESRATLQQLLSAGEGVLRDDAALRAAALHRRSDVQCHLPADIGDYTDFYASRHHASRVGEILRGPNAALNPNWCHLPVGYHGRASSVVPSGADVIRPRGQIMPPGAASPIFAPCGALDFELEVGAFIGSGNALGEPIPIDAAASHIFGLVLLNDWSARDIQAWEYVPLGPFNGKNFATQISPWVVTMEALAPFACQPPPMDPPPLPYLQAKQPLAYDVRLSAGIVPAGSKREATVATTSLRHLSWTFPQMIAHHTVGGCNLRTGDLLGSGTVSGPGEDERGCLLEASWAGRREVLLRASSSSRCGAGGTGATMAGGSAVGEGNGAGGKVPAMAGGDAVNGEAEVIATRRYLQDGDTVVLRGHCMTADGRRIGFADCRGRVLPCRQ